MNTRNLWSRILIVAGGIALAVGGLDPMEGSVLILPGGGLLALGTYLGGASGRSNWWGVLILPYLFGWSMAFWGPGSPRWLSGMGIAVGGWYLMLAFAAAGALGIVCDLVGVLTVGGCVYRLRNGMSARATTMLAGAGVVVATVVGVLSSHTAKARPSGPETYVRNCSTPTNVNGMVVAGGVEFYKTNNSVTFARLAADAVLWGLSANHRQ